MSKHPDRPYRGGRQKHWIKVKKREHHAFERVKNRSPKGLVGGGLAMMVRIAMVRALHVQSSPDVRVGRVHCAAKFWR